MSKFFSFLLFATAVLAYGFIIKSCNHSNTYTYKVARDPTWYPLSLPNKGEDLLAFSDELIIKISEIENLLVDLVVVGPNNLFPGLRKKQYDAIISSLTPSTITESEYLFSEPYILVGPVLLLSESSDAKSLEDLKGKTIGVPQNSTSAFEVVKDPSIHILPFENILTSLDDLEDGRIDGVIMNNLSAFRYSTGLYKRRLKVVTRPLTKEGLRLIALRGTAGEELVKKFNEGLKKLVNDGTYEKLINEWELCSNDCIPRAIVE